MLLKLSYVAFAICEYIESPAYDDCMFHLAKHAVRVSFAICSPTEFVYRLASVHK